MPPHGRERKPHYPASDYGTEAANPRLCIASPSQGVLRHGLPFSPRRRAPLPLGGSLSESEPLYANTLTGQIPRSTKPRRVSTAAMRTVLPDGISPPESKVRAPRVKPRTGHTHRQMRARRRPWSWDPLAVRGSSMRTPPSGRRIGRQRAKRENVRAAGKSKVLSGEIAVRADLRTSDEPKPKLNPRGELETLDDARAGVNSFPARAREIGQITNVCPASTKPSPRIRWLLRKEKAR